jgi:hypothetical protein
MAALISIVISPVGLRYRRSTESPARGQIALTQVKADPTKKSIAIPIAPHCRSAFGSHIIIEARSDRITFRQWPSCQAIFRTG